MKTSSVWVGLLLALVAYLVVQQRRRRVPVYRVAWLPGGYHALTLPPVGVFVRTDQGGNAALLEHETIHWRQYQRQGLIPFVVGYSRAHRRYGYDGNPYEHEARFRETPYCQHQYTACVRTGLASTVQNAQFRR